MNSILFRVCTLTTLFLSTSVVAAPSIEVSGVILERGLTKAELDLRLGSDYSLYCHPDGPWTPENNSCSLHGTQETGGTVGDAIAELTFEGDCLVGVSRFHEVSKDGPEALADLFDLAARLGGIKPVPDDADYPKDETDARLSFADVRPPQYALVFEDRLLSLMVFDHRYREGGRPYVALRETLRRNAPGIVPDARLCAP